MYEGGYCQRCGQVTILPAGYHGPTPRPPAPARLTSVDTGRTYRRVYTLEEVRERYARGEIDEADQDELEREIAAALEHVPKATR